MRLLLPLVLACLLTSSHAWAGDPVEDARCELAEALLTKMEQAVEGRDRDALNTLIPQVAATHNGVVSRKVRRRLQRGLGQVLGDDELGSVRMEAADALARLDDAKGAWSSLRKHVPDTHVEAVGPVGLRVLDAAGFLAYERSAPSLLNYVSKGRDLHAVAMAVRALGNFRYDRQRAKILTELLEQARKRGPSAGTPRVPGDEEARQAWRRVQDAIVAACNALTDRSVPDLDGWQRLLREHKRDPERLFETPR